MDFLILRSLPDQKTKETASRLGLEVMVTQSWEVVGDHVLFVAKDALIPWELVSAAMGWLEKWDLACPLWRYGVTAADVGTELDRERTRRVAGDLRQLLYANELLFVKNSDAGRLFMETWLKEQRLGGDPRLAFLRALHIVKPILCALPRTWQEKARRDDVIIPDTRPVKKKAVKKVVHVQERVKEVQEERAHAFGRVKVAPGVFIRCKPGEEKEALARYQAQRALRKGVRETA
jgi:hypothetical protein